VTGRLVVVSNDLAWYTPADRIAFTLQDRAGRLGRPASPRLRGLAESLEHDSVPKARFPRA